MADLSMNHIVSKAYIALKERLEELISEGVVNTVERWNNQIIHEEEEHQVLCPAVYIEIDENQWRGGNWEVRQGELNFILHVVAETTENFDIEDWELNQKVHEKIQGWPQHLGTTKAREMNLPFNAFIAIGDKVDHDYNTVIDNMLKYRTFVNDESLLRLRRKAQVTTLNNDTQVSVDVE